MQDIFTALCGRWWRVKVRFAGFLLALPLQNRRKASVEQLQVRAMFKFASVCKFELAQRLVISEFCLIWCSEISKKALAFVIK